MNKFYYLTLNYYCLYLSEALKGFELISGSTLISIYIMVWNVIIEAIKRIDKLYILYIIQIIFVSIPSLIIGLYFLIEGICKACCNCNLLHFLCCFIGLDFLCPVQKQTQAYTGLENALLHSSLYHGFRCFAVSAFCRR